MAIIARFRIYIADRVVLFLSTSILICKTIVFSGLLISISSDDWARHPLVPAIHAGYKDRCFVHLCTSNTGDPVWLIDVAFVLTIVNLLLEIINITVMCSFRYNISKINVILEGVLFVSTFIITDCGILFGIYISSYVHKLPMGYAYDFFISAVIFSIIDWVCSLKRLVLKWPERIYWDENVLIFRDHTIAIIAPIYPLSPIVEECADSSPNSIIIDGTYV